MSVAGILLAAGESTRMGQLKALLPWRGTTLLQSQLREMAAAGLSPLVVVLGHRAEELRALLPAGVSVALNARYREGKSTSIVTGVGALPAGAEAAVIVAVDQPTPRPPDALRRLGISGAARHHRGARRPARGDDPP